MLSLDSIFPFVIGVPFAVGAVGIWYSLTKKQNTLVPKVLHAFSLAVTFVLTWMLAIQVFKHGSMISNGGWVLLDSLSALFMGLLGLVALITGLHAIGYIGHEEHEGEIDASQVSLFYGLFHIFLACMLLALTSNNLIMMWVAIEATTVSSVFLVGIYYQRSSLEAAWKYVMLCCVGVAFGLFGSVLTYANAVAVFPDPSKAILWTEVKNNAHLLDPRLMQISFVFILIGFGTKTGLFPMHTWLPDAHSEAPSPVSGLLSAGLLNCALLVIIRHYIIDTQVIGEQISHYMLLTFGLLSVGISALSILVQKDIKRLLAYSSVENMGLITFALGLGPLGVFAAMLHTINHSLAKTLMFCGAGNIMLKYGTRDMNVIKGVVRLMPWTGLMFGAGALALAGVPPFNLFVSEFLIICAGIYAKHPVLIGILLVLLTIVLAGFARLVSSCVLGKAPAQIEKGEVNGWTVLPLVAMILLMLTMGTHIPEKVMTGVTQASEVVTQEKIGSIYDLIDLPWLGQSSDGQTVLNQDPIAKNN